MVVGGEAGSDGVPGSGAAGGSASGAQAGTATIANDSNAMAGIRREILVTLAGVVPASPGSRGSDYRVATP
ncbi:hypothetical protein GCM10022225_73320 [Plantactinospora mayteni]|uniref:Uncharacterized protein n=1 Tax=Plantactinospora mayteni TaxID=566021 RepID=A0ABQ4F1J6_9ACTN|nr:hypothetical protein Pma05_73590 [Plantactinospora mayteni]